MRTSGKFVAFVLSGALAVLVVTASALAVIPQARAIVTSGSGSDPVVPALGALSERSLVFDKNGEILATLHAEENRSPIGLVDVPDEVVTAIVSIEDEKFYEHKGVDVLGTARALVANVEAGGVEQGGSTITQQLVKNQILGADQDLERKRREAILAMRLEEEMSKDEILEEYLNTVYFGGGAYGVQAAAELYWGRDVADLGWAEAALLASLIRNPVGYDPVRSPEVARERRRLVLRKLGALGHIDERTEAEANLADLPSTRISLLPPPDDYFVEEVKQLLLVDSRLGATAQERFDRVFRGGLEIHTTIDPAAQNMAVTAASEGLPENDLGITAAIVSVEPSTGAVRALVGGPGFDEYKYNLATQGLRQPGSTFKTFVLAAGFEAGYVPADEIDGTGPCEFDNPDGEPNPYEAENFGGGKGKVESLADQTLRSNNCSFLRLGALVGLDEVSQLAGRLGIEAPMDPGVVSMPLGSIETTAIDMASAYGVFANGGVHIEPYFIESVLGPDGSALLTHRARDTRAVTARTACLVTDVLTDNVEDGTGTAARLSRGRRPAAGKTGTTQDSSDAWFVGYTPQLATAVWLGVPTGRVPMEIRGREITGGSYPAEIWGDFNAAYHDGLVLEQFGDCGELRDGASIDEDGRLEELRRSSRSRRRSRG